MRVLFQPRYKSEAPTNNGTIPPISLFTNKNTPNPKKIIPNTKLTGLRIFIFTPFDSLLFDISIATYHAI